MKQSLGVFERITILNLLPGEGRLYDMKVLDALNKDLGFSDDELKALKFREEGPRMFWEKEADKPKEVEFGFRVTEIIRRKLNQLQNEEKLTRAHIGICEMFGIEDSGPAEKE